MMATKRRMPKTLQAISIIVLLLNIINVNAVTDEEFSKLQSQMDTFAQRIVALEQKDFEKQRIIDKQQTIIKEQGDTIAEIQRDIIQQSFTVTKLQTTVKKQTHYINQQSTQLRSMRKALHTMNKLNRHQDMMSTKPSSSENSIETEPSSPAPMSKNHNKNIRKRILLGEVEPVAFTARLSTRILTHVGANQIIPFDSVILNLGNGYHNLHGFFIAPQSGLYMFSSSILSHYSSSVEVHAAIVHNGNVVAKIYAHGDSNRHDQGSQTVVIQVNKGEEVTVENIDSADNQIWGELYSSFSGTLLLPM